MNAAGKALSFAAKALYYGAVALSFLFVMAPSVLMMIVAFNDADYFSFPLKGVSLNWFAEMLENDNYRGSVVNSLKLAVYATALSVLMTLPASLWLYRRTNRFVETVLLAPLFFPLVIWSLGLLQLYGMLGLSGRFITLVLAHAVMVTPFILRVVLQSLREMNRRLEEAAYSLGAGRWSTFRRVILPIIMPGVLVGAVFGFLISFTDVTLTTFISSSGSTTFPVRVYSEQRSEGLNMVVLAWSAVITFVIFLISLLGEKFAKWSRYF
ncbi:MAG TPA: ABC transporter permease [Paenibacillaceae bacterium]